MTDPEELKTIISEHLNVDLEAVKDDAVLTELGMDSLDCVELLMAAEEEFNIDISDADGETVVTVGDAVALVKRILAAS